MLQLARRRQQFGDGMGNAIALPPPCVAYERVGDILKPESVFSLFRKRVDVAFGYRFPMFIGWREHVFYPIDRHPRHPFNVVAQLGVVETWTLRIKRQDEGHAVDAAQCPQEPFQVPCFKGLSRPLSIFNNKEEAGIYSLQQWRQTTELLCRVCRALVTEHSGDGSSWLGGQDSLIGIGESSDRLRVNKVVQGADCAFQHHPRRIQGSRHRPTIDLGDNHQRTSCTWMEPPPHLVEDARLPATDRAEQGDCSFFMERDRIANPLDDRFMPKQVGPRG